jgi:hypothetical protein
MSEEQKRELVGPDTPQTIEGVTVSLPKVGQRWCIIEFANGDQISRTPDEVRAMGLTVPEPTVPCRIGDAEFTLTVAEVRMIAQLWEMQRDCNPNHARDTIGAAARAHLDSEGDR